MCVQADVLGREVQVPQETESVLLGAAMLAMSAARWHDTTWHDMWHDMTCDMWHDRGEGDGHLEEVAAEMSSSVTVLRPDPRLASYHEAKYGVFREMVRDQTKYRDIMEQTQWPAASMFCTKMAKKEEKNRWLLKWKFIGDISIVTLSLKDA